MGKVILALDQGTTSSRALLFNERGEVVAVAQQEFPQYFPQPGWVEHDLEEIWQSQLATAREVLHKAGLKAADVHAIGITNQRETAALWERATGKPVARAIVWQCRRTAERCRAIREAGDEPMVREKTGLVADPYFSATKWEWLLERDPSLREGAEQGRLACGTIDSWLAFRLSGGRLHITDPGNAGRTMLYGLESGGWLPELQEYFHIPPGLLPEIVPSSARYGTTKPALFGGPIPIAGIGGDQQAALFGQGCHEPGTMKNTYGTGGFLLVNTGGRPERSQAGLLTSPAWRIGETTTFALEGSVFVAGAAVQWLRDGLGIIAQASETEALATSVEDTGGVTLVPAFVGLGAPHWNSEARGALVGITRGTTRAHVARAALEAIALQTMELVDSVAGELGRRPLVLRVDGGAAANNFLCQFQADLLGLPVERPTVLETTAAGAAYLAGLATGFWNSLAEVAALRRPERVFEPNREEAWRRERAAQWAKAVARVML